MNTSFSRRVAVAAVLAALTVSGCGTGQITGRVRFQGQPMTAGTVKFLGADGKEAKAAVSADGSYRVNGVVLGLARVSFIPNPANPFGGAAPAAKPAAVPNRYKKPDSSGLEWMVRGGTQEFNIDLEYP
jgi:hypothetical protein